MSSAHPQPLDDGMADKPVHVMRNAVVAWATCIRDALRQQEGRHIQWVRALSDDGLTEIRVTANQVEWRARGDHKTRWRTLDVDALIDGIGVPLEERTGHSDG